MAGCKSEAHRQKIAEAIRRWHAERLAHGILPPFTGHKLSKEHKRKFVAAGRRWRRKYAPKGEDHPLWLGERGSYGAKHDWIRRHYKKTGTCELCKRAVGTVQYKGTEWANISGEYRRDRADFMEACHRCHARHDQNLRKKFGHTLMRRKPLS